MTRRTIDPSTLQGVDLENWYLRSPAEIEAERQASADDRHQAFFKPPPTIHLSRIDQDRAEQAVALADDVLWIANGRGGFRAVRSGPRSSSLNDEADVQRFGSVPTGNPPELIEIGNPQNSVLKRQYIREKGPWLKTADGRDYDVSHRRAIADGGTNTLDNIEPMHPDEHRAKHARDGDNSRFAKRRSIARAFGGRVEPPANAPKKTRPPPIRGLGPLGIFTGWTGILSGRIRTDSFDNFSSDMMGWPSQEDLRRNREEFRKRNFPGTKPGDLVV